MQTIKTAAIVVLMLTVLYGGYLSLTTPPEPLPEEIEEYLVIDESGGGALIPEPLESGDLMMPESFDDSLQLGGPPPGMLTDEATTPSSNTTASEMIAPPSNEASGASVPNASFADLPPAKEAPGTPRQLPLVDRAAAAVTPGPIDSYASTSSSFQLPDPEQAASKFDPDKGIPFPSGSDLELNSPKVSPSDQSNATNESRGLINAIASADALFAKGQLKEALATLSVFYGMPDMSDAQRSQLLSRLDPLARDVIYSQRHLLEQPYRASGSESLVDIAKKFDVPWQLLANINHIDDPVTVLPGTELKMVRGPFRAEVDLTRKAMTLFLGDLYAGRFEIGVGNDPAPTPGTFTVQDKQTSRTFYGPGGITIPAGSPENPYGNAWLDLGAQVCIHGSPNTVKPTNNGCISVAGDFADDVFGILSQGSTVTIKR